MTVGISQGAYARKAQWGTKDVKEPSTVIMKALDFIGVYATARYDCSTTKYGRNLHYFQP